jgi:Flp pilus assembly protein TadG
MRTYPRRGAVTVEFALVVPIFFLLVLGIIEFGRAMMVGEMVNNAARAGCRGGVLAGRSNSDVASAAASSLTGSGIANYTCTVKVNGVVANASTAQTGDAVAVTITVPYSQVSWLPDNKYLGNVNLTGTVVMRRE